MLRVNSLSLHFDGKPLFDNVNISFDKNSCYGVIGANGAGKSTFLKLLSKELEPTKGNVSLDKNERLSFLKQDHFQFDDLRVIDAVIRGNEKLYNIMIEKDLLYAKADFSESDGIRAGELEEEFANMDGWNADSDAAILLQGLGITTDKHELLMKELDGKDKVKVLIAQALFGNPDILLLDEPTNHLDIDAVRWLEEFIINLESTVIVVSHDRHFINKICTVIADIDYGKIQLFAGNYDFWYESSQLIQKQLKDSNKKKEDKMKELQDFIDRFSANASKSKQATSRKQALKKISLEDIKPSNRRYPFIDFRANRPIGNSILTVDNLIVEGLDNNISLPITITMDKQYNKVALIGEKEHLNTNFLKSIVKQYENNNDNIQWGNSVQLSSFEKDFDKEFNNDLNIVDWLMQYSTEKDQAYVRGFLGRMLFSGEDALKKVKVLSGGEKVRCMFSKMMIEGSNVLILDDPTNHLDMESITALNDAMIKFEGLIIFTSHDYQILDTVANRVIRFNDELKLEDYLGTYEEYLAKREK
ncbi:MAG: ABC-F family ATP-binding cassette domain-containing protein [Anaerorhabdus sp.]